MKFICRPLHRDQTCSPYLKTGLLLVLMCCSLPDLVLGQFGNRPPTVTKNETLPQVGGNTGSEPSCNERNSCAYAKSKWHQHNCFCDELCTVYDDCCIDFTSALLPSNSSAVVVTDDVTRPGVNKFEPFRLSPEVIACDTLKINYRLPRKELDKVINDYSTE